MPMRTHDLVSRLAHELAPIERDAISKRLNKALLLGMAGGTMLLVVVFGVSSSMPEQMLSSRFWIRLAFPLVVIAAALQLVQRLARPGASVKFAWLITLLPIAAMMLGALGFILATPAEFRLNLVPSGTMWGTTIANTILLSLPSLIAMIQAMRRLAPTRLALSGAGAGLLAGAQGVLIYALYCPSMPLPYWGILHVLAIFMTTAIGAALGPGYLRW